jgi:predicted nucleotidyltransferase
LQRALQQLYGKHAPVIMVYGSQARKEARSSSDIDILLIFSHSIKPGKEITRLSAILADLNLRYQVLVSVLPVSQSNYQ